MSLTELGNKSDVRWHDHAAQYDTFSYGIIRRCGDDGFDWIMNLEGAGTNSAAPRGLYETHSISNPKDLDLLKDLVEADVFLTTDILELHRMWDLCKTDEKRQYLIVKVKSAVDVCLTSVMEDKMLIEKRREILSRLSDYERKILGVDVNGLLR